MTPNIFQYAVNAYNDAVPSEQRDLDGFLVFADKLLTENPVVGMAFHEGAQCLLLQDRAYVRVTPATDVPQRANSFRVTEQEPDKVGTTITEPTFQV